MSHEQPDPFADATNDIIKSLHQKIARLEEWKRSVLLAVKTIPEYKTHEWGGDKEGWGFIYELIKWVQRERDEQESIVLGVGPITCRNGIQHKRFKGCLYCAKEKAEQP